MLEINVPHKAGDIVTVKLSSSEEIIATLTAETGDTVTVEKPVILIQGQQGVGMMPWMMSAEETKINIKSSHVMAIVKTQADVAKAYTQNTTSIQMV